MKGKIKLLVIIIICTAILYIVFNTAFIQNLSSPEKGIETIKGVAGENKAYILLITLLVMMIHNALPIIPLILVITINNTIFGLNFGFTWSLATSLFSAAAVFLGIRYGFQGWVIKRLSPSIMEKVEENGLWYVLQARIFPFVPTSIINLVSGVSNMRFWHFMVATVIGNTVLFLIYTLIQAGLLSTGVNEYVIGIVILAVSGLYYLVKKLAWRKKSFKKSM